jgi:hypothetical protein
VGEKLVARVTVHDKSFACGKEAGKRVYTHNTRAKIF